MQPQSSSDTAQNAQTPQTPPAPNVPVADPASAAPGTPEIADDGDLIEKDWVDKVKHIVQMNKHDPFVQSQQFAALKADYLLKRYGKVLNTKD